MIDSMIRVKRSMTFLSVYLFFVIKHCIKGKNRPLYCTSNILLGIIFFFLMRKNKLECPVENQKIIYQYLLSEQSERGKKIMPMTSKLATYNKFP